MVQTDKLILNIPHKEKMKIEEIQESLQSSSLNLTCRFLIHLAIQKVNTESIEKYREMLRNAELYKNYLIFR